MKTFEEEACKVVTPTPSPTVQQFNIDIQLVDIVDDGVIIEVGTVAPPPNTAARYESLYRHFPIPPFFRQCRERRYGGGGSTVTLSGQCWSKILICLTLS